MVRQFMGRVAGAVVVAISILPALAPAASGLPDADAARPADALPAAVAGASFVLEGHGNGHGIGLSQWGALGYAVDDGWDAERILGHYYGGTVAGAIAAGSITVRLTSLDNAQTAVVQPRGHAVFVGDPARRPWSSLVARETTEGLYRVWGRVGPAVCPAASVALDDPALGWTVVADAVVGSVLFDTQTDVTTQPDVEELLAVCEPKGTVRSYRGRIRAANGTAGENRTINDVPMEQYLRSVVPAEVSSSWGRLGGGRGVEALMAQAVAARSYAATQNRYTYAATCDTQSCQVYVGAAKRSGPGGAVTVNEQPETDMAVAATAGRVRRVGGTSGPIANTMFSASSGGYTAPSESPGFPAVVDDGDDFAGNSSHSWSVEVPTATIEQAWPQIGQLTEFTVTQRNGLGDQGGRVLAVSIAGTSGAITVTGDDVRKALNLRSNWFAVRTPCLDRDAPPVNGSVPSTVGLGFVGINPTRIVDTRTGVGAAAAPIRAGCTLVVPMPTVAGAAAITLTTTGATANGYTTVYPCGTPQPNVSAVQVLAGVDVPGTTVVPIGADGTICVFASIDVDVILDVLGWFRPEGSRFAGQVPERLLDSRRPSGAAALPAATVTRVQVTGGVRPAGAVAASVNITATGAASGGYVTAFPCGGDQPVASVLNLRPGVDVSNHAFVALDPAGGFCLWNSSAVHLIADIDGWYATDGGRPTVLSVPQRLVDSRLRQGTAGPWAAGETRAVDLGEPAAAVLFELSGVDAQRAGYLTVAPCGGPPPEASVLNLTPAGNVANLVVVPTDDAGQICLTSSTPTDVLIDVIGRSAAATA